MTEGGDAIKLIAREADDWIKKQKLLQMSEISLILDTYDDIFSDFDPRPLERRTLSDDFLIEMKNAAREKKDGVIELNFLIPSEQRNSDKEQKIHKRLREHFKKHYDQVQKEIYEVKKHGVRMSAIGFLIAIVGAMLVIPAEGNPLGILNAVQRIMLVLIEPAAWFLIWTGFDKIFTTWKEREPDLEFYRKMIKSELNFTGY
ncbi:MAG: hypothetical protein NTY48_07325 [Candidatus Diapherotrites archaeon]|nr:hypothetical protein [Candidatus Diapherotrites archaeon]